MAHRIPAIIPLFLLVAVFPGPGRSDERLASTGGLASRPVPGSVPAAKIEALVVGTIHQRHRSNENYSYADVAHILAAFDPDLICVEIRPQDFRKVPYLDEMVLATIWGLSHGKAVAPIDWWDDSENVREVRAKLAKQPEYIEKEKQEKTLYLLSPIIAQYEKKYGPGDAENQWSKNLGYEFWNGRDYNEYYAEVYRISMQIYGDSPFNLYYETRNGRMMDLIRRAVRDHRSRRVIVLTGSEHKHYFDREFKKDPNVATVDFKSLLPLPKRSLEPAVMKYIDEGDDSLYYEKGYPQDPDGAFRDKLVSLVHGPDMDVFPDTVPADNIEKAGKIIDRWKAARAGSSGLLHEEAWLDFLRGEYSQAAQGFLRLAEKIDRGEITDPWRRFNAYLNLGRCYDLLGEREKALKCYARSEELLAGTPWERVKDYIFQDYRKVPFKRAKGG